MQDAIIIRHSGPADSEAINRLAALDDRAVPRGDALLAFVDDDLAVARAPDGYSVADPFRPTAELRELVALRAVQENEGRAA
ncbi:MAG TPA: hypothetical protein VFD31_03960 [Thermoleophilaceae bacterium]|nr:hypothetical protein [Thermoleophilaceae bacterium]